MTKSHQRHMDRLRRVVGFGSRHQKEFAVSSRTHALFGEAVDLLNNVESVLQPSGPRKRQPRTPSADQDALRNLISQLERIESTARILERENPRLKGKFSIPDKRKKDKVVAFAQKALNNATPLKDEFLAYEMPEDFLWELAQSITTYQDISAAPRTAPGRSNQTNYVKQVFQRVEEIVGTLDVMIGNKFHASPSVMDEWNSAVDLRQPANEDSEGDSAQAA